MQESIEAIILAGGKSSRMGCDKALLVWQDRTLLSQICTLALKCASQVYVVTPWTEKYQNIVPQNCQLISEPLLNPEGSNSPLIGFACGLPYITTEWILLLACDLPRLSSTQIEAWYANLAMASPKTMALLPRNPKGWEPLCGFYRRTCLTSLTTYLDSGAGTSGQQSFQNWLNQNLVEELPITDAAYLFNCNTPEDWIKLVSDSQ
jgi:molybdopterin-guanine dinucleotide biosynthesis protein A